MRDHHEKSWLFRENANNDGITCDVYTATTDNTQKITHVTNLDVSSETITWKHSDSILNVIKTFENVAIAEANKEIGHLNERNGQ